MPATAFENHEIKPPCDSNQWEEQRENKKYKQIVSNNQNCEHFDRKSLFMSSPIAQSKKLIEKIGFKGL